MAALRKLGLLPEDPEAFDDSDADFRIAAYLEVTSPNGGEAWQVGSTQDITWNWQGTLAQVKIEYTADGASYELIGVPENSGSFAWQVPDHVSNSFQVRVSDLGDYSVSDTSDDYAIIVLGSRRGNLKH